MPAGQKEPGTAPGGLDALAALGEPTRRALYGFVTAQDRPVSRDEAAAATGTKRATAAFHLERLVEDGLLEARFARLSGRTGPGAGRTAKLYARGPRQVALSSSRPARPARPSSRPPARRVGRSPRVAPIWPNCSAGQVTSRGTVPVGAFTWPTARSTNWSPAMPAWSAR
jgi:DNA-binding transcriptional ArsR family regulator